MAGYQNKKGYSGADLDAILYDHATKASPTQVTLNITSDPSWNGVGKASGNMIFNTEWGDDFPYSKFSYNGATISFNFLNQESIVATIIGQKKSLGSDFDTININNIILTASFIAHDSRETDWIYHLYTMQIIYNPTLSNTADFIIVPVIDMNIN